MFDGTADISPQSPKLFTRITKETFHKKLWHQILNLLLFTCLWFLISYRLQEELSWITQFHSLIRQREKGRAGTSGVGLLNFLCAFPDKYDLYKRLQIGSWWQHLYPRYFPTFGGRGNVHFGCSVTGLSFLLCWFCVLCNIWNITPLLSCPKTCRWGLFSRKWGRSDWRHLTLPLALSQLGSSPDLPDLLKIKQENLMDG